MCERDRDVGNGAMTGGNCFFFLGQGNGAENEGMTCINLLFVGWYFFIRVIGFLNTFSPLKIAASCLILQGADFDRMIH